MTVDNNVVGAIDGPGLLVLLGVTHDDGTAQVERLASKVWQLRIMRDELSASDLGAPILVISQFTLYGDARKGRRPTWNGRHQALRPSHCTRRSANGSVCSELQ